MFPATTLADVEWLISEEAAPWLAAAAEGGGSLPAQAARLRKGLSAERAALVLEQVEVRRRAAEKFPQAARMFFSRRSLEQSTDAWVAAYKAQRFPSHQGTADLCCGLGGDALALAARGPVVAVELDPRLARLAEANASVLGLGGSLTARVADVTVVDARSVDDPAYLHIDPDRRPADRRTSRLVFSEPPLETVEAWRAAVAGTAVKLAPASDVPESWAASAEREWISRDGVCRQQVAWSGGLTDAPGRRRATCVSIDGIDTLLGSLSPPAIPLTEHWGRYLHEPDAAVIAAGLVGELAHAEGFAALDPRIAYLTSDTACARGLVASFEILETMPFDQRRVKQALARRGWGRLEIKLRGVEQRPEALRQAWRVAGDECGSVLLARLGQRSVAILARRA